MSIKWLLLVTMCVAGFAVTANAQRGGGGAHGSSGEHAGAVGGGFSSSASRGFSNVPRFTGSRPFMSGSRPVSIAPSFGANYTGIQGRQGGQSSNGYRRPYNGYRERTPYLNGPWSGWGGATLIGYPGYSGFDDGGTPYADDSASNVYNQPPYSDDSQGPYVAPDPGQSPYPQAYAAYPQFPQQAPAAPAHEPQPEEAVTLVFKDGRPSQQIHNYMLTSSTLYVRDQHHSEIPLTDLDVPATKQANRAAGIDFELVPKTP